MAETYRISKVMKFIETLRTLQKTESEYTKIFSNHLKEQLREIFPKDESKDELCMQRDIHKFVDYITTYSYEQNGISFSNSQFSLFKETIFHSGCTHIIDNIIKEMGEFFDLDIPENIKKSDLEKYNIKAIDTKDYSTIPRKYYFIIGGMGKSFSEAEQEKSAQYCEGVLLKFLHENEIFRAEKGFIVQTALQNIPNISTELIYNNIGVYGIIPIEEKNEFS